MHIDLRNPWNKTNEMKILILIHTLLFQVKLFSFLLYISVLIDTNAVSSRT